MGEELLWSWRQTMEVEAGETSDKSSVTAKERLTFASFEG